MSLNVYKVRKYEHFDKLLSLHHFKPIITIFIKDEIEKNKKVYKDLKDTIKELSKVNVYILILLINTKNMKEFEHLRDNNYIQMYYKTHACLEKEEEIRDDNLIMMVSLKICDWNKKFIEDVLSPKHKKVDEPVEKINEINNFKGGEELNEIIHNENIEDENTEGTESISSSNRLELERIMKIQNEITKLE